MLTLWHHATKEALQSAYIRQSCDMLWHILWYHVCVFKNLTWPVVYIHSEHVGKLYTYKLTWWVIKKTVDGERFAGLNIHGFSAIEVFTEMFSRCLGHKYSLFSIIKERHLYSRKHFCGTPVNREKRKSLAQWIFPCLRHNEVFIILKFTLTKNVNWWLRQ